jgi:hypothetical protein
MLTPVRYYEFGYRIRGKDERNYCAVHKQGSHVGRQNQEVTKRCLLSWLTNSGGRGRGCGVSDVRAHGAQINFGDLTPYLTYGQNDIKSKEAGRQEEKNR